MSIFVTGDTHGSQSRGLISRDGFISRLSTSAFPEQRALSKDDFVVICGDFGGVWETSRFSVQESKSEKYALDWLEERSFTTLFVPGNHENYDRLTGCHDEKLLASWFYAGMPEEEKDRLRKGYPRIAWNGGYVRQVRPSVLMLERGEIFTLGEKTCFAFGGARSHDISDGILDPAAYPDHDAFTRVYRSMTGKMFRVRGVSWWEAEMPTASEMDYGRENLKAFMGTHDRLDFVFTHDAPSSDRILLGYSGSDPLCQYLESLRDIMKYSCWFYGHLHDNRRIMDNHYLLYEQILQIA